MFFIKSLFCLVLLFLSVSSICNAHAQHQRSFVPCSGKSEDNSTCPEYSVCHSNAKECLCQIGFIWNLTIAECVLQPCTQDSDCTLYFLNTKCEDKFCVCAWDAPLIDDVQICVQSMTLVDMAMVLIAVLLAMSFILVLIYYCFRNKRQNYDKM